MTKEKKLWPVMVTAMFASFMNPLMLSGVTIALPDVQHHFNCSATQLSWVVNVFLLSNAIMLMPLSKISDIQGRVKYFKLGLLVFTLFTLASALSTTINMLLAMRILQGVGAAMMQVTGMAIVTSAYPPQKRGVALGMNIGAVYTGLSLGPFVGGLLTQLGGWQMVYFASVPFGIIALVLAQITMKENLSDLHPVPFDWKGSLLFGLAIFCVVYGGGKILTAYGAGLFVVGAVLFYLFYRFERKLAAPIFNFELFKTNKLFSYSNFAALIHYTATSGMGFLLSLYLQFSKGLTPRDAGLIMVAQPILMAVSAPLTGKLSDKVRPGILASVGMMLTLLGLFSLTFLHKETPIVYITAILVVIGLGFGFFTSPNTNAIMGSVEKRDYGIASGTSATMRVFGQTLSMMVATVFISLMLGTQQISANTIDLYMKSMHICFVLFALLCIPGIWFSLQRSKR